MDTKNIRRVLALRWILSIFQSLLAIWLLELGESQLEAATGRGLAGLISLAAGADHFPPAWAWLFALNSPVLLVLSPIIVLTRTYTLLSYAVIVSGVAGFWFAIGSGVERLWRRGTSEMPLHQRRVAFYSSIIGILASTLYLVLVVQALVNGSSGGLFVISQLFWSGLLVVFFVRKTWSSRRKYTVPTN